MALATLPDLSRYDRIALDLETHDFDLIEKGPSVFRGGYIVGIAIGAPDGKRWYLPYAHAVGEQYPKEQILAWAKTELCRPGQPKIGANILYDLSFLDFAGVPVTGPFYDVQVAEPLLNENRGTYKLDSLALQYLGVGKDEEALERACEDRGFTGSPKEHIWRLDPCHVAPYAEADADRTLRVFDQQKALLEKEGLWSLFELETRLIPILLAMRQRGVRIDRVKVLGAREDTVRRLRAAQLLLKEAAGKEVDVWANESIAAVLRARGVAFPLTAKTGIPSFTASWLEKQTDPVCRAVIECRKLDKFLGTFLEGAILGTEIAGRIHTQFHPLRGDDYGTVTGRFSSSQPNLQQIPKRDEAIGPLIRSLFVPEPGELWGRTDYASIEIRILAHYATGRGADEMRAAFVANPKLDYHQWCADMAGLPGKEGRQKAKSINFGLVYGMGVDKLARQLSLERAEAKEFLESYHRQLPFIKATMTRAGEIASSRGYVHTILGRRRHFDSYEPADWDLSQTFRTVTDVDVKKPAAVLAWIAAQREQAHASSGRWPRPGVKRAWTYKALNAVIQGTSADLLKTAMVQIWEAGLCKVLGAPLLTVHDEIDFSVPDTAEGREAFAESVRIMETAIPFRVPILAEAELLTTWGA